MPYPMFSQGVPDDDYREFVFSRGPAYPSEVSYDPRQLIATSESGLVRVATIGPPDVTLPLVFTLLPQADIDGLLAWLMDARTNWSAFPFTYTDVVPLSRLVRYAGGLFMRQQVAGGLYDVRLTLRVEVT